MFCILHSLQVVTSLSLSLRNLALALESVFPLKHRMSGLVVSGNGKEAIDLTTGWSA